MKCCCTQHTQPPPPPPKSSHLAFLGEASPYHVRDTQSFHCQRPVSPSLQTLTPPYDWSNPNEGPTPAAYCAERAELGLVCGGWGRGAIRSWHRDSDGVLLEPAQEILSFLGWHLCLLLDKAKEIWKLFISVICLLQFRAEYRHRHVSRMHTIQYIVTLISGVLVDKKIGPYLLCCLSKIVRGY